jgi:hypothetical protein
MTQGATRGHRSIYWQTAKSSSRLAILCITSNDRFWLERIATDVPALDATGQFIECCHFVIQARAPLQHLTALQILIQPKPLQNQFRDIDLRR